MGLLDLPKKLSKKFEKPLDKKQILCYNKDVRKREGKLLKTRKGNTMTKNTLNVAYSVLSSVEFEGKETVLAEFEKELNRGKAEREAKDALYESAKVVVMEALRGLTVPVTVAELYEECKDELPRGFSKNQVNYGLTHQWADEVTKIEGKVNSYRIK